jgi:Protein of unknown function (DUF559)
VVALAMRQWGVVARTQLLDAGFAATTVDSWIRDARLTAVHRGVYAVGHAALRREGRWLAAVLACGADAVLSHRSAATLWGLLAPGSGRIEVTVVGRRGPAGIHVHRTRSLAPVDRTIRDAIPVTSLARTLLDLAATLPAPRLERALAQAERLRVYDHRAVEDVLARANGHRGRGPLTAATSREAAFTRSDLEVALLELSRRTDLPIPNSNVVFDVPDYGRAEVDFLYPADRLVVETDGWDTHRTRAAFEADRARDAALQAAGYRVLRFTARTDEATVARRVLALTRAGSRPRCG